MTAGCIYRERISAYLDGDLSPDVREEVRRHLASTPPCGCASESGALAELRRELGALAPGPPPADGWARVAEALDRRARRRGRRLAWAAAALIASGAGLLLVFESGPDDPRLRETDAARPAPALPAAGRTPGSPKLPDDLVVRYGAEIAPVDRLLAALRGLPAAAASAEVDSQIALLTDLRADLMTELVLEARAR